MLSLSQISFVVAPFALVLTAGQALAGKKQRAHDHGHASMSVAVDGNTVAIDLDTPAQGLYGFEYEPKTEGEKKTYADANAKFQKSASELFAFAPDLGCQVTKSSIAKEGENEGAAVAKPAASGKSKISAKEAHSDMAAEVTFACAKDPAGSKLQVNLIKIFPLIKKIKVQILTGTKQAAAELHAGSSELSL